MSSSPAADWMEPAEAHTGEVRKLSTLLEASQALSGTLDLKESLQRVLEILGRHHGAVRSTVVLLNESTGEVELEAFAGAIAPGKRVRYRVGEGITGQVVQTGKPMVVPRVSREPTFLNRTSDRPELPEAVGTQAAAARGEARGRRIAAFVARRDGHAPESTRASGRDGGLRRYLPVSVPMGVLMRSISLLLVALAASAGEGVFAAPATNIVADQIRAQGYKCDSPQSAKQDTQAS